MLFVAPILPATTGNGLAMRAGVFLDALARDFSVTLLVVPVAGGAEGALPRYVVARTVRVISVSLAEKLDPLWELISRVREPDARADAMIEYPRPALCRYATTPCLSAAAAALAGERFAAIHVMRSYLAPYAAPFLPSGARADFPSTSLDLDDDEAETHRRLAALHDEARAPHDARIARAEALKYERHEVLWLPRFRRVLTCTAAHAGKITGAFPACRTAVVPNTVALPVLEPRRHRRGKHILFVGNLSYPPNVHGIRGFANDVMPSLRASFGASVALRVAGSAPAPELATLAAAGALELVADPADLAPHYAWADLAVVPLDAGGGTRIKLLEAFAHSVPVVASTIGAEGVEAEDGVHLLLADTPPSFADACARVLADDSLAARLAGNARRRVEARYSHAAGEHAIRDAFAAVTR